MTQKTLHDFFKVKGPLPKIQNKKSPKPTISRAGSSSSMMSTQGSPTKSPRRKRLKRDVFLEDEESQVNDEIDLEEMAISHIRTAIYKNNPNEVHLNDIYDIYSTCGIKLYDVDYKGKINPLHDKSAESLFKAIFVNGFLNPINCEYFSVIELKMIMSIFELSIKSKIIVTRLLKWTKPWYRVQEINDSLYQSNINEFPLEEISLNSGENGIFKVLDCEQDIMTVLQSINMRDLQEICKRLKRQHSFGKERLIEQLLGLAKMNRSLFPGAKTPRDQLLTVIKEVSGTSIQLSDLALDVVKRILILIYPVQSRFESVKDVFWMITEVDMGRRNYPGAVVEYYPVFRNRQHVIDYAEAKSALINITTAIKVKNWPKVKELSTLAHEKLMSAGNSDTSFITNQKDLSLPSHVRRFTASFVWSKVLILSIDSPKKDPNYATFVGEFLKSLINYDGVSCASIGRCYSELSAVEMKYNKNFEECARLIEKGLSENHLSIIVEADLVERARKLAAKATGITESCKNYMATLHNSRKEKFECTPIENHIEAKKMHSQSELVVKSVWLIDDVGDENSYAQVEIVAQSHYMKNGFSRGLHCEGSLPATLCACIFWNEIYNLSIPGAFICRYQHAPLDLWSSMFVKNRQDQIQERISMFNRLDIDDFCEMMRCHYDAYRNYTSLITSNLFRRSEDITEIVRCLGQKKVMELSLILLNDYYHMSAGFPDLIVWNPDTLKCKIVEVKGPGDSLSIKQKLWINRLMECEIDTEVCYVKAK